MNRFSVFLPLSIFLLFINIQSFAGVCWVTNTNDSGTGSLREAINCANSNVGADSIKFALSGTGPWTITPLSQMPIIRDSVTIDGLSQNNSIGKIIIDGINLTFPPIWIESDNCTVKGIHFKNGSFQIQARHNNTTIVKNIFSGCNQALTIGGAAVSFQNILIKDNFFGIDSVGNIFPANKFNIALIIVLANCSVSITGNKILGNATTSSGIRVSSNSALKFSTVIDNNEISFCPLALGVDNISGAKFSKNIFNCNDRAIVLSNSNNNKQKPVITSSKINQIKGTSQANDIIEVFYFNNTGCPTAACQGKIYLGTITADASGNWTLNGVFTNGNTVTATATDNQNNTSEFAACVTICTPPSVSVTTPTQTLCNGSTVLLTANTAETGLQYQWSRNGTNITNATQTTYSANQAGQYAVKVTRANGCDSTATLFIKPQVLVDSGLIAYYPFDGDALDYSGNGNHGTPQNNLNFAPDRQNNASNAANFANSNILIPKLIDSTKTQLTVSMWVYETQMINPGSSYLGLGTHDGGYLKGISHSSGTTGDLLYFNLKGSATFSEIISMPFNTSFLNKWKHYVMTYNNGTLSAYIDGILLGTKLQAISISKPELAAIAQHWYNDGGATAIRFTGKMDDIRIYNRALTAAEIQLLYKPATYNFARCTGDTLKLTAPSVSGVSYTWKKGATTLGTGAVFSKNNIALADTGTYNLDISYKGCTFSDTTVVNSIKAKPSVTLNDTSICSGSSAYLQVPTGFSKYQWSVGSSTTATNTITPLSTQPVSVTVTNANGCTASATATVTVLPASLNCGLVAHYKLDGNAADSSGNGNHGTPVGGVTWAKDRFGNCNGAANLDGRDDYIATPVYQRNLVEYSVSAWVNLSRQSRSTIWAARGAIEPGCVGVSRSLSCEIEASGKVAFALDGNNLLIGKRTSININPNQWYHIVGVFKGNLGQNALPSQFLIYVNGVLQSGATDININYCGSANTYPTPYTGLGNVTLGYNEAWFNDTTSIFDGRLNEIRIYNRALSVTEVQQIYQIQETGKRPPSAQITNSTPSVCAGSTTLLTAAPTGTGLQYQWYKDSVLIANATATTYSTGQAGRYQVRVTDATGCDSLSVATTATVNSVPIPTISGNPLFCKGLTNNLTASGGTSYKWQTGVTTSQITINQAGTYTVTVTNANNCTATKSIDVAARTLVSSAGITDIPCYGQKIGRIAVTASTIGTANAPYTFTWSGNVGTPTNVANSSIVNTLSAGNYPLSIRDVDGCRLDTAFTIRQPDSIKISLSSLKNENCSVGNNGQIILAATGGTAPLQYQWSRSAQDIQPTITNLKQGNYTLTVTDAAQCAKSQTFTLDLTKDNLSAPTVSITNSTTSSITFSWSSVSNADRYEVKIKDSVWMAPNGNLQHTVSGLGELETIDFKVRAISSNPLCTNALIGNIQGTTKEKPIDESCLEAIKNNIPNAFSPNDDGENDTFDPQQYFTISGCPVRLKAERLIIVNQWGEIIWEANPYTAWNGYSGKAAKPVLESAYFYVLVLRVNGGERMIRGAVNVFPKE